MTESVEILQTVVRDGPGFVCGSQEEVAETIDSYPIRCEICNAVGDRAQKCTFGNPDIICTCWFSVPCQSEKE
jgi:hypothetical protein